MYIHSHEQCIKDAIQEKQIRYTGEEVLRAEQKAQKQNCAHVPSLCQVPYNECVQGLTILKS